MTSNRPGSFFLVLFVVVLVVAVPILLAEITSPPTGTQFCHTIPEVGVTGRGAPFNGCPVLIQIVPGGGGPVMGSKAGTCVGVSYAVNVAPASGQWLIGEATILEFFDGDQTDTRAIEFVNCGGGGGGDPGIE